MHARKDLIRLGFAALAAVSLVAVACGDDDDDDGGDETATSAATGTGTATTTSAASQGTTVRVQDNAFNPSSVTVSAGTTVTWSWSGENPHSLVGTSANAKDLIKSDRHTGTGTAQVKFDKAGTYEYECGVHGSSMTGTVVVQ